MTDISDSATPTDWPEFYSCVSLVLYDRPVRDRIRNATNALAAANALNDAVNTGEAILFNVNSYTGEVSYNAAR